jgi:F-type H+-transporting ATPase subunit delta
MGSSVIDNFSQALISLAEEKKHTMAVQHAAAAMLPSMVLPEARQFLNHPSVKIADKKSFLAKIIPPDAPQEFVNFVLLIVDRRYTRFLPELLDKTVDLAMKAQGCEVITVITAREIDSAEENYIRQDLETRWSTKVFLKKRQNPSLIGGIIIQREDRMYDGSILGRIKSLRRKLTEQSVR